MNRIFFIDPQSYSNLGVYDYSLLNNNIEFDILFFGNTLFTSPEFKNIKFIPLFRYSNHSNKFLKISSYFVSIVRLFLFIIIKRPNLIHIQWIKFWWLDYYFLKLLKKCIRIKIVYTAHNILPHESKINEFSKYQKYYHIVDVIITHAINSKKDLIDKFSVPESKIEIIPHGILSFNTNSLLVENYIKQFKLKYSTENKIVFATLGNQSFYKGSDIIARIWSETPQLHDESKYILLIFGKNNNIDFSNLDKITNVFIENRFVNEEEFTALLRLTNVLLLPYRTISQSGVLLSAINESIPVLVSNVGGLPEPLEIADIGWNIGEASFENLQKYLLLLINSPQIIDEKKINKENWDNVKSYYSWVDISKKTFKLYNNIID